jgi:diguanylate cyclase (GGDEF)-like protein
MNFHRIANSIVTRIVVLGMAVVLSGAIARYYFLTDFLRRDLGAVIANQQQMLAGYVANDIDAKIVEREKVLQQMAATLPLEFLQADLQGLRNWVNGRNDLLPWFFDRLMVLDPQGAPMVEFPQRAAAPIANYRQHDYFSAALAGAVAVGRPELASATGTAALPIAVPIKDAAGQVRALLVGQIAISAPGFLTIPAQTGGTKNSGFLLVSPRDRMYVAATDSDLVLKPTPPAGVDALHDRAMSGYRGSGVSVNDHGIEHTEAVASVPSTGWFVVARIANTEGLASIARATRYFAINSTTVAVIFLLIATGLLISIFRPLFRAADIADRMTRGETELEPLPVEHADEVGHLTAAFNRLLAKLQSSQLELARMAHHDSLTGLPNGSLLADRIAQALARAQRNSRRVGVLYLDLDSFKPVNDELGHGAGDTALVEIARRLAGSIREADTVARVGGDEFIIVMEDLDPTGEVAIAAASTVAEKCIAAISAPMSLQGQTRRVGVSIGIAIGDGQSTADSLRKAADEAMYQAKNAGRLRYVVYAGAGSKAQENQIQVIQHEPPAAATMMETS